MGTNAVAKHPSRVLAHCTPMFSNICRVNRGKLDAKAERRMMFAATADAALQIVSKLFKKHRGRLYLHGQIGVNEIVKAWEEDAKNSEANENPSSRRCSPVYFRSETRPAKPR
jgi:hypothetical protein